MSGTPPEGGQSSLLAALGIALAMLLGFGGLQVATFYADRAELQTAADAAVLAAAARAQLRVTLAVSLHTTMCTRAAVPAGTVRCRNGPTVWRRVSGSATALSGSGLGRVVGCRYLAPARPPANQTGRWTTCDSERVVAYAYAYPDRTVPLQAATAALGANRALLRGGHHLSLVEFHTATDGSGTVDLTLEADFAAGLLAVALHHPFVQVRVSASGRPGA